MYISMAAGAVEDNAQRKFKKAAIFLSSWNNTDENQD
jgi:hypothetical protein